jgi:hypothetical protein
MTEVQQAIASQDVSPLMIISGSGSLPFTIADAARRAGRRVVLYALQGLADPQRVASYPHYWGTMGQFTRFCRLARQEHCRDVVFIGGAVRPSTWRLGFNFGTLLLLPEILPILRGGDNHLLTGVARILEVRGFRLVGAQEIAPEILAPEGLIAGREPGPRERADIARGLSLLHATSPFDIGQATVVADNRILAIEAAEGTDRMLAHVAHLRREGRIAWPGGTGVVVKAPKRGQDRRLDLPSIGPQTVDNVAAAGLAGIAIAAGSAIIAELELTIAAASRSNVFVYGVSDGFAP